MHRQWTFFLICWTWLIPANGQTVQPDSTWTLSEVDIYAPRNLEWSAGQFTHRLDSGLIREFDNWSLSDLLLENSNVFVKSYGPGALAGPSLRGGSSAQTALVWNGLNMQSSMNGQLDLSLIPVSMIQDFYVQYGGGSALYGSGAMGGSLHIQNKPVFGERKIIGIKSTVGSFGKKSLGAEVSMSKRRFYSSSNILFDHSDGWTRHAAYAQKAFMHSLGYQLSEKDQIWGQVWGQHFQREIPFSSANQEDALLRSHVEWNHVAAKWKTSLRSALMNEKLVYEDSVSSVFSDNLAQRGLLEGEANIWLNSSTSIHVGANMLFQHAEATAYNQTLFQRNEQALFASLKKSWLKDRWSTAFSFRQAWVAGRSVPFMPSWGLEGYVWKNVKLTTHISKNYRIPTFNDLYWQPGGNQALLPESGWGEELGLRLDPIKFRKYELKSWFNIFNRQANNWIIWLPGPAFWSPENVPRVWSRGIEAGSELSLRHVKWKYKTRIDYSWVKSTRQFSLSPQDAGENKQLIYIPEHQVKFLAKANWQDLRLIYTHQFVGKRYTTTDNEYFLPAYHLGNLRAAYRIHYKQLAMDAGFRIANIWNTSYMIVSGRSMPMRNYTLNLSFYFKQ